MDFETKKAALRAAAKITLSIGATACAGSTASTEASSEQAYETRGAYAGDGSSHRPGQGSDCDSGQPITPASCLSGQSTPDAGPPPGELDCCRAHVASVFEPLQEAGVPHWAMDGGAETQACCQALAEDTDRHWGQGTPGHEFTQRDACCTVLGWNGSMACTPWGPPPPPAMPEAWELAA